MKHQVRLSKKEQKRARTQREQQTYDRHKRQSRNRSLTIRDWGDFFSKFGIPAPSELRAVIDRAILEFRDGGISPSDYGLRIFDPECVDLTSLPIGLLDHKEEELPLALLPQTRGELEAHCERMIIRNRDEQLVDAIAEGWPGRESGRTKFNKHVTELWLLRRVDPDLYRFTLCGQHNEVLYQLKRKGVPREFTFERVIQILVRHGLLWCTNDIQLILARNALGERNPFGLLVSSDYRKLEPVRIVNDMRGHLLLLRTVLALYATIEEEEHGKAMSAVPESSLATVLNNQVKHQADINGVDLLSLRSKLDSVIPVLRRFLKKDGKRFRRELDKPVENNELGKHFAGIWFSGLSNVQAAAVPILRFLQAEADLEGMIRNLIPIKGVKVEAREGTALPAFDVARLNGGWRDRAKDLLFLYRQQLLGDSDISKDSEKRAVRSPNAGWEAIKVALDFLNNGERLIPDDHGDENSARRTYYLLDVVPETRLYRQADMIRGKTVVAKIH